MAKLGTKLNRSKVTKDQIEDGLEDIRLMLLARLDKKGRGAYASRHEILGILEEEMIEVKEAIRDDTAGGFLQYKKELLDVAVGALFGFICLDSNHIKSTK